MRTVQVFDQDQLVLQFVLLKVIQRIFCDLRDLNLIFLRDQFTDPLSVRYVLPLPLAPRNMMCSGMGCLRVQYTRYAIRLLVASPTMPLSCIICAVRCSRLGFLIH